MCQRITVKVSASTALRPPTHRRIAASVFATQRDEKHMCIKVQHENESIMDKVMDKCVKDIKINQ